MNPTARRAATAAVGSLLLVACEKILGIHDLHGGSGNRSDAGFDAAATGAAGFGAGGLPGSGGSGESTRSSGGRSTIGDGGSGGGPRNPFSRDGGSGAGGIPAGFVTVSDRNGNCNIAADTRWDAPGYVIECNVQVDATLTIAAGTTVMFGNGYGMSVSSAGRLNAKGTASSLITFTSMAKAPAAGDWKGIALDTGESIFDYCTFSYAGANDTAALTTGANRVTITNSIFRYDESSDDKGFASVPALDASQAAAGSTLEGNTFYGNRVPLVIGPAVSIDDMNHFDDGANPPTQNQYNGIDFVGGCGENIISGDVVKWSAVGVPIVIGNSDRPCLQIRSGGSLRLGRNVTLKFLAQGTLFVDATSTLTTDQDDVFTSIHDDAHGGDTDGDGSDGGQMAKPEDWNGIDIQAGGLMFDHCSFYYAGGANTPALTLDGVSGTVTNSTFAHNGGIASAVVGAPALGAGSALAGTTIAGNLFYANSWPLQISPYILQIGDTNTFHDGAGTKNTHNGIAVAAGCGVQDVKGEVTWSAKEVPFVIGDPTSTSSGCLRIDAGDLTLQDNVTLKFFKGGQLFVASGATLGVGHNDVFTVFEDDAHGGDTNADGNMSTPSTNEWSGIDDTNGTCKPESTVLYAPGCP